MRTDSLPDMEKAFAPAFKAVAPRRKAAARTALVDLQESARALLSECFRQFGIETVPLSANAVERLRREKFEACVLSLNNGAEAILEAARTSPSNSRCVIYALGGDAQQAMRYSKYGINAIFHEPLERPAAVKLVRATHMLVLHEFRRYVRIPVMTEVSLLTSAGGRFIATSIEMSTGGMSLKGAEELPEGTRVETSFALLTLPRVTVRGVVSWKKGKSLGIRFDVADDQRLKIKTWINSYLEK